jgi:hypothetical protein
MTCKLPIGIRVSGRSTTAPYEVVASGYAEARATSLSRPGYRIRTPPRSH